MKRFIALLVIALTTAGLSSAKADVLYEFEGTFTYTFTQTHLTIRPSGDPLEAEFAAQYPGVQPGDTFTGAYHYFSPTMDIPGYPWDGIYSDASFSVTGTGANPPIPFFNFDFGRPLGGSFVVVDGHVTDAEASYDKGPWVLSVDFDTFRFAGSFEGVGFSADGTIAWGDPHRVPDTVSTLGLLAGAVVGLAAYRRKFRPA